MVELIEKIKSHTLGNKEEAFSLYFSFCNMLKKKYGLVDKDFDENPTKRGKEWLDIHHVLEYELDDIAMRTHAACEIKMLIRNKKNDEVVVVMHTQDIRRNDKLLEEIRKDNPQASQIHICGLDYTLEELKPYNVKEQLVYANKIEHFLLHYLIDSIRGQDVFSGGPNYLWDCAIALDVYGFDQEYLNKLQADKERFYSIMPCEEITRLYKKLINWKKWDIQKCSLFWKTFKGMLRRLRHDEVSYVVDKCKFFDLFDAIDYKLNDEIKHKIAVLPFKVKIIGKMKVINRNLFSMDEKTLIRVLGRFNNKTITVPSNAERIAEGAFVGLCEKIIIPITVKEIDKMAFTASKCPHLKKIEYRGTKEMWDTNFSNVELTGLILVCKKF